MRPPSASGALAAEEALLRCLRRGLGQAPAAPTVPPDNPEWAAVVRAAVRHRVEALLYARVQPDGAAASAMPAALRQHLEELYGCHALRNQQLYRALSPVLTALVARGIPVIVLKGAFLAGVVYQNPAERAMADVDLLVHAADLGRAAATLGALGYKPAEPAPEGATVLDYSAHHHLPRLHKAGAAPIEVHHTLTPARSALRLDMAGLWGRAQRARVAGVEVLALAPVDLVLHLCVHAAYGHRFRVPLRALYDIAATLEHYRDELDGRALATLASAAGCGPGVACTMRVVERLFGGAVPALDPDLEAAARVSPTLVDAVRDLVLAGPGDLPSAYQEARAHGSARAALGVLARSLVPSRERLRQIYRLPPDSRRLGAYYLYRPLDLLVRRGRFALELLLRTPRARQAAHASDQRRLVDDWLTAQEHRTDRAE